MDKNIKVDIWDVSMEALPPKTFAEATNYSEILVEMKDNSVLQYINDDWYGYDSPKVFSNLEDVIKEIGITREEFYDMYEIVPQYQVDVKREFPEVKTIYLAAL